MLYAKEQCMLTCSPAALCMAHILWIICLECRYFHFHSNVYYNLRFTLSHKLLLGMARNLLFLFALKFDGFLAQRKTFSFLICRKQAKFLLWSTPYSFVFHVQIPHPTPRHRTILGRVRPTMPLIPGSVIFRMISQNCTVLYGLKSTLILHYLI